MCWPPRWRWPRAAAIGRTSGSATLALSGPYKVNGQAVWVDGTRGLAVALEPNGAEPRTHRVAIGRNVTFAAPTPDRGELLVLTAGKEAIYKDQTPEEPALTRLLPDSRGLWVKRRFPLPAAFDRLATSADGRYAVAYYAPRAIRDMFFLYFVQLVFALGA